MLCACVQRERVHRLCKSVASLLLLANIVMGEERLGVLVGEAANRLLRSAFLNAETHSLLVYGKLVAASLPLSQEFAASQRQSIFLAGIIEVYTPILF